MLTINIFTKTKNLIHIPPVTFKDTREGSIGVLMKADSLGVEDENFMDTADALYEERENIIETINNTPQ